MAAASHPVGLDRRADPLPFDECSMFTPVPWTACSLLPLSRSQPAGPDAKAPRFPPRVALPKLSPQSTINNRLPAPGSRLPAPGSRTPFERQGRSLAPPRVGPTTEGLPGENHPVDPSPKRVASVPAEKDRSPTSMNSARPNPRAISQAGDGPMPALERRKLQGRQGWEIVDGGSCRLRER